jgi:TfoX/Sxy family transcriptional regulator of competence genes
MASDSAFVEYVCDQARNAGQISHRKMFGEYAIYLDNRVVALVCDNQLYVKPTMAGRALLQTVVEGPPYPGARNHFLIGERIDDRDLLSKLFVVTHNEVPEPKPRKQRSKGKSK